MQQSAWFEVKENGGTFLYADAELKKEGNFDQDEVVVLTGNQEELFLDFLEANGLYTDDHCEGPLSYFEAVLWGLKPDSRRMNEIEHSSYRLTLRVDDENGNSENDTFHEYIVQMPTVSEPPNALKKVVEQFLRSESGRAILQPMTWKAFNWGDAILQVDWAIYGIVVSEASKVKHGFYETYVVPHDESLLPQ